MPPFALTANESGEAKHHVQHIIDLVAGEHLSRMKKVQAAIDEGNVHDAEHTIEDMLAGTGQPGLSIADMHLQMALSSIRVEEASEAAHHLEYYVAVTTGHDSETGAELLSMVQAGELHDAEHEIEELLGGSPEEHHADEGEPEEQHSQAGD